jgi:hypothetical protein
MPRRLAGGQDRSSRAVLTEDMQPPERAHAAILGRRQKPTSPRSFRSRAASDGSRLRGFPAPGPDEARLCAVVLRLFLLSHRRSLAIDQHDARRSLPGPEWRLPGEMPRSRGRQPQSYDRRARIHQLARQAGRARQPQDCDRGKSKSHSWTLRRDVGALRRPVDARAGDYPSRSARPTNAGHHPRRPCRSGAISKWPPRVRPAGLLMSSRRAAARGQSGPRSRTNAILRD